MPIASKHANTRLLRTYCKRTPTANPLQTRASCKRTPTASKSEHLGNTTTATRESSYETGRLENEGNAGTHCELTANALFETRAYCEPTASAHLLRTYCKHAPPANAHLLRARARTCAANLSHLIRASCPLLNQNIHNLKLLTKLYTPTATLASATHAYMPFHT